MSGVASRKRRKVRRAAERVAKPKIEGTFLVAAAEPEETPERRALAVVAEFAKPMPCANCDHAYSSHLGTDGPCTYDMGDDETCGCEGYKTADEMAATAVGAPGVPVGDVVEFHRLLRDGAAAARERGDDTVTLPLANFALVEALAPVETLPAPNPSPAAPATPTLGGTLKWTATLCPEGVLTDDGRVFAPGSISWRELPLTLMAMIETSDQGHNGALVSGRIDVIWRDEASGEIKAAGEFDAGDYGAEIARMVDERTLRGVSVDIAVHGYERGPRSDYFDEDGNWRTEPVAAAEEPNLIDVLFSDDADLIFVVTAGVIGAATVCPFPAFAGATIALEASLVAGANPAIWTVTSQAGFVIYKVPKVSEGTGEPGTLIEMTVGPDGVARGELVVTASAAGIAPLQPPVEWFEDPEFTELTPLTVDDEGRIFGHAWQWDFCHTGIPDVCTTAPHSHADYAYFHLGEIVCDGGERITVGKITIDAPHASHGLGRADATAHYDNTGTVAGHVVCGEDEFGGWIAGALHSAVSEDTARLLRGAVLSGDWRNVNGNLELVALLAVNVPGFPVPRVKARVEVNDDGAEVYTLVAAGVHAGVSDEQRLAKITALGESVRLTAAFEALAERARG